MTSVRLYSVGRSTFDLALGRANSDAACALLNRLGVKMTTHEPMIIDGTTLAEALSSRSSTSTDLVVLLQATFADASAAIALSDAIEAPILVWSFPEPRTGDDLRLNSLCGANLTAFSLRRRQHPAAFLHLDPAADGAEEQVNDALHRAVFGPNLQRVTPAPPSESAPSAIDTAQDVAATLHGQRIGIIGERPAGFEPCDADDTEIGRIFGVGVERVPLISLFEHADDAPEAETDRMCDRMCLMVPPDDMLDPTDVGRAARLAAGLDRLAVEHEWHAVATRCWPECMVDYGAAVCTAQSLLTERGVPAVCEADALGSLTALIVGSVAGSDAFVADLVDANQADNTSVLWHCGSASPTLADDATPVRGIAHPTRHVPLVNQFALRSGRVTLARISQLGVGLSMVIATGTMLPRPRPFSGTCGVVQWDHNVDDIITTVFDAGIEHHLAVVYGDYAEALVALASVWDLPVVQLGHSER